MIIKSITTTYRVECAGNWDAMPWGCSGFGPRGVSKEEAEELAIENGWGNHYGKWLCPGHLKAHGKWWPQWYRDQEERRQP